MFNKDFESKMIGTLEVLMLKKLANGDWLGYDRDYKVNIPREMMVKLFDKIDHNKIMDNVLGRLENKIADIVVNQIATELSNDVKSIMSDRVKREKIREVVNEKLWDMIEKKTK